MIHLSPIENLFAVEVPDVISDPDCYRVNNESIMLKWNDVKHPLNPHDKIRVDRYYGDLKDYKWPEILFTTKGCSENDAAYAGFPSKRKLFEILRANGLDESKNYLLIKKQ